MLNGERVTTRLNLDVLKNVKKHLKERTRMIDGYSVREWKSIMANSQSLISDERPELNPWQRQ
jgi:hypothetical protein